MFNPAVQNLAPPCLVVDGNNATVRPESPDGDSYYGLASGTNGTAAATRRAAALGCVTSSMPLRWVCSDGKPAAGLNLIPSSNSDRVNANPWVP